MPTNKYINGFLKKLCSVAKYTIFHLSHSLYERSSFVVGFFPGIFWVVFNICGTCLHLFDRYLKANYVTGIYFSAGK